MLPVLFLLVFAPMVAVLLGTGQTISEATLDGPSYVVFATASIIFGALLLYVFWAWWAVVIAGLLLSVCFSTGTAHDVLALLLYLFVLGEIAFTAWSLPTRLNMALAGGFALVLCLAFLNYLDDGAWVGAFQFSLLTLFAIHLLVFYPEAREDRF